MLVTSKATLKVSGPADLGRSTLIAFAQGCSYRKRIEEWLGSANVMPERILEFESYQAMIACVAAGTGFAVVPKSVLEALRATKSVRQHAPSQAIFTQSYLYRVARRSIAVAAVSSIALSCCRRMMALWPWAQRPAFACDLSCAASLYGMIRAQLIRGIAIILSARSSSFWLHFLPAFSPYAGAWKGNNGGIFSTWLSVGAAPCPLGHHASRAAPRGSQDRFFPKRANRMPSEAARLGRALPARVAIFAWRRRGCAGFRWWAISSRPCRRP